MKRTVLLISFIIAFNTFSQIPTPCLVGYWQNWSAMKLSEIHENYNVIELAFATTKTGTDYDMEFNLPSGYSKAAFLADIDNLHTEGKVVILSIGGANDPVILDSPNTVSVFINSINQILSDYDYKIDGIDLDLESTSLDFGDWTMNNPAHKQLNIITAVKQIKADYFTQTGKRMLLTMAPETVYLQGALSEWQVNNINGGAYLPILNGLMDDLDVIFPQYYNAGGASGGTFANNGIIYYDTGDPDYLTALTETLIKGFTLKGGKGFFSGVPASKVAIGLPANNCNAAGTGYVTPQNVCDAVKYLKGEIQKPVGFHYSLARTYPNFRGLMTWSINEDADDCSGIWSFAENFNCAFASITALAKSTTTESFIFPTVVTQGEWIYFTPSESLKNQAVIITNIQGKQVYYSNKTEEKISSKHLPLGIYILRSGSFTQRLIVN